MYIEIPWYTSFIAIFLPVLCSCALMLLVWLVTNRYAEKISSPETHSRLDIQIDHISRVYENAKDGIYKQDMKAALDGLQELRNIACEQTVLNDNHSSK